VSVKNVSTLGPSNEEWLYQTKGGEVANLTLPCQILWQILMSTASESSLDASQPLLGSLPSEKIQQLHFLGTQNLPLVEDSHHEMLYEIVIPEMVISSHLPFAYLLRQIRKNSSSAIVHLRHELHRRQTWVDQRIQRDVLLVYTSVD
jgi:hypothetical protein